MVDPQCPYFGICGGCTTQHIPYDVQLENKRTLLQQLLKITDIRVFSDASYGYRNRMDFVFHPKGLGFRRKGKWHSIVDIASCAISNNRIQLLLQELRSFFATLEIDAFHPRKHTGTFRYAVVRTPGTDASISFILNKDSSRLSSALDTIRDFARTTSANHVLVGYVPAQTDMSISEEIVVIKGDVYLTETICGRKLQFHSQGFFQNNSAMAEKLVAYVREQLHGKHGTLLDLYGGVGAFGIACSDGFDEVVIVEAYAGSITCAERNVAANNISGRCVVLDAKRIHTLSLSKPLCAIIDPPRSGMHPKAIGGVLYHAPERVVYVSCNPRQLAKELPLFLKRGYGITSCALFDLFPQTNHMEVVVVLDKLS